VALSGAAIAQTGTPQFEIKVLSSPSYAVTGGDALLQIRVPAATALSDVYVRLNGQDVSASFQPTDASTLRGLVSGIRNNSNVVLAGQRSTGQILAKILVVGHLSAGPVFSGPHQTPYVCETDALGLGTPVDADCAAPTRVDYFYRSTTTNTFLPFNASARPTDIATTTTAEGLTVPYIVRREMGTLNRAVYVIAILHDPAGPLSTPYTRTSGYNGRLVYSFGGGCQAGYHQGRSVGGLTVATNNLEDGQVGYQDYFLSKGYASSRARST
jgi:hypothetical protein